VETHAGRRIPVPAANDGHGRARYVAILFVWDLVVIMCLRKAVISVLTTSTLYIYLLCAAPDEEDGDIGDDDGDDAVDPDALSYEELTALGEVVGTVACGLSAEQLAALPRSTFAAVTAARLELQKRTASSSCKGAGAEQCAVCRIEFEEVDEVVLLPCRHCYHPECISQWLQQKKVCPQCNKDVVEDALLAN